MAASKSTAFAFDEWFPEFQAAHPGANREHLRAAWDASTAHEHAHRYTKHGMSHTPTWYIWSNLRGRCDDPKNIKYADYGGRGITYDPRWRLFINFFADMGARPEGMTLDRKNNDGNYCKENCRWVTRTVNANNRRSNVFVEYKGERLTVAQLAKRIPMDANTLRNRIAVLGYSVEQAVQLPRCVARKTARYTVDGCELTLFQISRQYNLPYSMLWKRIQAGVSLSDAMAYPSRKGAPLPRAGRKE